MLRRLAGLAPALRVLSTPIHVEEATEATRLTVQHRLYQRLLPLVPDAVQGQADLRALDIGCGPGGWVHDVAHAYPEGEATGIDVSRMALGLARSGATELPNAFFEALDATQPLPFTSGSFDLVQLRHGNGFLLDSQWSQVVGECVRITRPGGCVRLIECGELGTSNDASFARMAQVLHAAWRADPAGRLLPGTPWLAGWLRAAGCTSLMEQRYVLDFSAPASVDDEVQHERHVTMASVIEKTLVLLRPFVLRCHPITPAAFDALAAEVSLALLQPTFRGQRVLHEVVGLVPCPPRMKPFPTIDARPTFAELLTTHQLTAELVAAEGGVACTHADTLRRGEPTPVQEIDLLLAALSRLTSCSYDRLTVGGVLIQARPSGS